LAIELPSVTNPMVKDYPLLMPIPTYALAKFLKNVEIDIVHVHHPFFIGQIANLLGKVKRAKLIFTYHTRYGELVKKFVEENVAIVPGKKIAQMIENRVTSFARKCDAVIATTKTFKKSLSRIYKVPVYFNTTAGLSVSMKHKSSKVVLQKKIKTSQKKNNFIECFSSFGGKEFRTVIANFKANRPKKNSFSNGW